MKEWSTLLVKPIYLPLPKSDLADVKENIDNWIARGCEDKIKTFLVPDENGHKGYRFINTSDLQTVIVQEAVILGVPLTITNKRLVKTSSHLDPLWFTDRGRTVDIRWGKYQIEFSSDAQLKRVLKGLKNDPYKGEELGIYDYVGDTYQTYKDSGAPTFLRG